MTLQSATATGSSLVSPLLPPGEINSQLNESARAQAAESGAALTKIEEIQEGSSAPDVGRLLFPPTSSLNSLPVQLNVSIPIPRFTVRDLVMLEMGNVLETEWIHTGDVPVSSGQVNLVWAEFEVVDQLLAVRVTRMA